MKIYNVLITIAILLGLSACSTESSNEMRTSGDTLVAFKNMIKKFTILPLPLTILTNDFKTNGRIPLDTITDQIFIENNGSYYCYGMLPDTSKYYALIYFAPADRYIPGISVFDKKGKLIANERISVGLCGYDCGFDCSETIILKPDKSIFSVDSMTTTDCDSMGKLIPNTTKRSVVFMTGRILESGKIKLSKETKKQINTVIIDNKTRELASRIMNDSFPEDVFEMFPIFDGLNSPVKEVRDFYFPVAIKILTISDGALSEKVCPKSREYIETYPKEFLDRFSSCDMKGACYKDLMNFALFVADDIRMNKNLNLNDEFNKFKEGISKKCKECNESEVFKTLYKENEKRYADEH